MQNMNETKEVKEFLNEYDEKVIALAQHLGLNLEPDFDSYVDEEATEEEQEEQRAEAIKEVTDELDMITENAWGELDYYGETYLVLTDSEADDIEDERLNQYIEECIMPEIPEHLQNYFDEEAWKRDARMDGRGHNISTYDGCEYEEIVNDTWYYIYRV